MKIKILVAVAAVISTFSFQSSTLRAQGTLTPPGAPAPTMKSLDQIEPRTPIASAPFTISSPGSYYLTTNLTVTSGTAISITANGVTLDLGGFTVVSTAASANGTGIYLSGGNSDITIFNGHIRGGVTNNAGVYNGPGFYYGIYYTGTAPKNVRVKDVSVSGCLSYGIYLHTGSSTVVEGCTVENIGNYGIFAESISHSSVYQCGGYGIYGTSVADSTSYSTGSYGIYAQTANNCNGYDTTTTTSVGIGIFALTANGCYGYSYGPYGDGIAAATANNCYGQSAGSNGNGVSTTVANNCYGYSTGSNGTGVHATLANNCYGSSSGTGGTGLFADYIAIGCLGGSSVGGVGLNANIANSCVGDSAGNAETIAHKYNMP